MEDNLCDSCSKPMSIQRTYRRARFLVCRNEKCKRGQKNATRTPVVKEPDAPQKSAAPRKSIFGIGL
jgi:ssDNA-binding Zn-finger/Zn-ribbon topoisomerase 1